MNILFISTHNPFDAQKSGTIQRTHLLLEACSAFASVDVVSFKEGAVSDIANSNVIFSKDVSFSVDESRIGKLKRILKPWSITSFFHIDKNAEQIVDNFINTNNYDYIVVRYLPTAIHCGLLKYSYKLVIDVDDYPVDVERLLAKKVNTFRSKIYHHIVALLMQMCIMNVLDHIKYSFFPNAQQVYSKHSSYLPNIPFYDYYNMELPLMGIHRLLFVGDLRYEPNYLGVEHFINKIYPLIKNSVRDVELYIVGKTLDNWKNKILGIDNTIKVLGFVEDIVDVYNKCTVCIIPVYLGAGTNIKVLEALQMRRASVVTSCAMRGFNQVLYDGSDLCEAKTDNDFAEKTIMLLKDYDFNCKIANNGFNTVKNNFSKEKFINVVKNALS